MKRNVSERLFQVRQAFGSEPSDKELCLSMECDRKDAEIARLEAALLQRDKDNSLLVSAVQNEVGKNDPDADYEHDLVLTNAALGLVSKYNWLASRDARKREEIERYLRTGNNSDVDEYLILSNGG